MAFPAPRRCIRPEVVRLVPSRARAEHRRYGEWRHLQPTLPVICPHGGHDIRAPKQGRRNPPSTLQFTEHVRDPGCAIPIQVAALPLLRREGSIQAAMDGRARQTHHHEQTDGDAIPCSRSETSMLPWCDDLLRHAGRRQGPAAASRPSITIGTGPRRRDASISRPPRFPMTTMAGCSGLVRCERPRDARNAEPHRQVRR